MPKASSVTQQSRQRVAQSQTEYRERPKPTWVQMLRRSARKYPCLSVCHRRTRRLSSRSLSNSRPPWPTRRRETSHRCHCRCRWAGRRPRCVGTWSTTTTTTWRSWQGCLPHQWRRVWFDHPACRHVYPNYRPAAACRPPVDTITWPALTNQMTSSINSTASRSFRKSFMTHT